MYFGLKVWTSVHFCTLFPSLSITSLPSEDDETLELTEQVALFCCFVKLSLFNFKWFHFGHSARPRWPPLVSVLVIVFATTFIMFDNSFNKLEL